ncbi:MAG: glycoside hydrolase family 57 protein [Candidatus Micrarchaeota archaeon]
MASICLYFHIHQPMRLNKFSLFHQGGSLQDLYFNAPMDRHYFEKAKSKCYGPTNSLLLRLAEENYGRFKFSFSVTGTFLEQAQKSPAGRDVVESLQQLASTNCVEFIDETYYHSLASLYPDMDEFRLQVLQHRGLISDLFNQTPKVFRNTEVIYSNRIASEVEEMGYKGILTEGIEWVLGWRSANFVYRNSGGNLGVLLRNYKLSDDIGYRFSARWWPQWPLTADKYARWLSSTEGQTINLFMDYETFGEHHWQDTGILQFLRHLPEEALKHGNLSFKTCSETLESYDKVGEIDVPFDLSWADMERDVSAWLGNRIQHACFSQLQVLGEKAKIANDPHLSHICRLLQTSDHLYYLCTKSWSDGDVHKHFSPYKENSPYDNFINYMNILQDFGRILDRRIMERKEEGIAASGKARMREIRGLFEAQGMSGSDPSLNAPAQNGGGPI